MLQFTSNASLSAWRNKKAEQKREQPCDQYLPRKHKHHHRTAITLYIIHIRIHAVVSVSLSSPNACITRLYLYNLPRSRECARAPNKNLNNRTAHYARCSLYLTHTCAHSSNLHLHSRYVTHTRAYCCTREPSSSGDTCLLLYTYIQVLLLRRVRHTRAGLCPRA